MDSPEKGSKSKKPSGRPNRSGIDWQNAEQVNAHRRELTKQPARRQKKAAAHRAWREKNAERLKASKRAYYIANRERILAELRADAAAKARAKEYQKRLRAECPGYYKDYLREYRAAHRATAKATTKAWKAAHPARVRQYIIARRVRKQAGEVGDLRTTQAFYELVKAVARIKCYWCGKNIRKRDRTVDHVKPLAKGGPHAIWNLVAAHRSCNSKKGSKLAQDFTGHFEIDFTSP